MEIRQQECVLMKDSVVCCHQSFSVIVFKILFEKIKSGRRLDLPYTVVWTVKGWYSTTLNIGVFWEVERVMKESAGTGGLGMPLVKFLRFKDVYSNSYCYK